MDCTTARDAIVDALTERKADTVEVIAHLATCDACTRFASRQRALDARLASVLVAPPLGASFRAALHARIRRERRQRWLDHAPDVVHFVSCGVATAICCGPGAGAHDGDCRSGRHRCPDCVCPADRASHVP